MLQSDPDWTASLHVGHREERRHTESLLPSNQSERLREEQRWTTKTRPPHASMRPLTEPAAGRPAVRPWRDFRSLLQSVLQRQTNINQPSEDRKREQPAAVKESHLGFRDFFRDSLQASLEASSRLRALSARPPSISEEYNVELSVKVPSLKEQHPASSSSSCLNCVRLQRRIVELQQKLSHLTGEQEDTEAVLISDCHSDQSGEALQRAVRVDKEPVWTEPLSPPEWALHVGVQDGDSRSDSDSDSADKSSSSCSEVFHDVLETHISGGKPRPPPRFQKVWLTQFPFLRYSPSLNQMWCHVCRLYADKSHQNLAMIKGSSVFRFHNVKQHGSSSYHKENMERHLRCHQLVTKLCTGKSHHRASSKNPQTPKM